MNNRILGAAAALAITALALVGCTSDPLSSGPDTGASGSPAAASCDKPTPLNVVVAPIQFEPTYIAQDQGYFAEHCLDVTIVPGGAPAQNIAQLVSGAAQIATASIGVLTTSAAQGIPVVAVVGNGYTASDHATSGIIVMKSSGIKSVKDLVGKTVGIQGLNTGSEIGMFVAAEHEGIDPLSIVRVETPSAGMETALEQGTLDAVLASAPQYNQIAARDDTLVISNPSTEYLAGVPVTPYAATKQWLADNGDTAKAFIAAMQEADKYYNDPANVDSILDITAKVSQQDRSKLSAASLVPVSAEIDLAKTKVQVDAFTKYKIITTPVTVDQIIWSGAPTK